MIRKVSTLVLLVALTVILLGANPAGVKASTSDVVYVVPVERVIDRGLASFVKRSYAEAEANGVKAVILEIDTPGGYINDALAIRDTINHSSVSTIAFVRGGAISAGALIALVADTLVMAPGTTIGAAEPRLGNKKADEKTVSYWAAQLAAAAEEHNRNPKVAAAMADADIEIPNLVEKGKLLTLTDKKAKELGMIDAILASREEVLSEYGLNGAQVVELNPSLAEQLARWITSPLVSSLLLTLGLAGLVIEIFTIGFGIAGTIGLLSLGLYFAGHMLAGLTGWEAILLFLLGLILLAVEALVIPGFGVAGIGGIAALVVSIVLASPSLEHAVMSLVMALVGTIVLLFLSIKLLPTRNVWHRLILGIKQKRDEGYMAPRDTLKQLEGSAGVSITPLRPAGAAEVNGERIDVVSDGGFIPPNTKVKVVKVEGTRVVVRRDE